MLIDFYPSIFKVDEIFESGKPLKSQGLDFKISVWAEPYLQLQKSVLVRFYAGFKVFFILLKNAMKKHHKKWCFARNYQRFAVFFTGSPLPLLSIKGLTFGSIKGKTLKIKGFTDKCKPNSIKECLWWLFVVKVSKSKDYFIKRKFSPYNKVVVSR